MVEYYAGEVNLTRDTFPRAIIARITQMFTGVSYINPWVGRQAGVSLMCVTTPAFPNVCYSIVYSVLYSFTSFVNYPCAGALYGANP